ncbi:MAG: hypothetical protein H6R15_1444 [Proteobacteria bacterium]|nr:hypothetical protein [Pseudomonadota bacterium]
MFRKFNLLAASLALALFVYAQHQGWNMFDDTASSQRGASGGGRVYHK